MLRQIGGVEKWNGLATKQYVAIETLEGYLGYKVPPRGAKHPSSHQAPCPEHQFWKKTSHNICLWKTVEILSIWVRRKDAGNPGVLLKDLLTDFPNPKCSLWATAERWWLRRYQKHTGRDQVVWLLQNEGWRNSCHCSCVEPSSPAAYREMPSFLGWALLPQGQIWNCIGLVKSRSTLVTPWDPDPLNSCTAGGIFGGRQPVPPQATVFLRQLLGQT